MIIGITIYLLIGVILVVQHFFRFYSINEFMYKNKAELMIEAKWYYLFMGLLWPFGLDCLFGVSDYRKEINDELNKAVGGNK